MCEINPTHKLIMRLEVFTSQQITKEEFDQIVYPRLMEAEMFLNKDGNIRVHIHET